MSFNCKTRKEGVYFSVCVVCVLCGGVGHEAGSGDAGVGPGKVERGGEGVERGTGKGIAIATGTVTKTETETEIEIETAGIVGEGKDF